MKLKVPSIYLVFLEIYFTVTLAFPLFLIVGIISLETYLNLSNITVHLEPFISSLLVVSLPYPSKSTLVQEHPNPPKE